MKLIFIGLAVCFLTSGQAGCRSAFSVVSDTSADQISLTSINSPLPDGAFNAAISLAYPLMNVRAGQQEPIHVILKNTGHTVWPAFGQSDGRFQIKLGNHWLDRNGRILLIDDGRSNLPYDLKPGDEAELLLRITYPQTPGEYILELDMVQEQVAWFNQKGSNTLRLNLRIE